MTAAPTAPVASAVAISMLVRETSGRSMVTEPTSCLNSERALPCGTSSSVHEPPFLFVDFAGALLVVFKEGLQLRAREVAPRLRGPGEIILPLGSLGDLLQHARPEVDSRLGRARRQGHRARHLVGFDAGALLLAGRDVAPALGRGHLRALRHPLLREDAQRLHLSGLPMADALARIVRVGLDVSAGELHRCLAAALERHVDEPGARILLDEAGSGV